MAGQHALLLLRLVELHDKKIARYPGALKALTYSIVAVSLFCLGTSVGCAPKCRAGTVLEGGICRRPDGASPMEERTAATSLSDGTEVAEAGSLGRASTPELGPTTGAGPSTASSMAGAPASGSLTTTNAAAGAAGIAGQEASRSDEQNGTASFDLCGNEVIDPGETCDPATSCPTSMTCVSPDPCLVAHLSGDAATCTAECELDDVTACTAGDSCCPKGCTSSNDSDCSPTCGDGELAQSESCEPSSSQYPCPASCDDGEPCTSDLMTGSPEQCNVTCTNMPITVARSGDGCCAPNADANSDSDCEPRCGNGVVEAGEICDGNCPTSCDDRDECTIDNQRGSSATCDVECEHVDSNTAECLCGNGRKDSSETCDDSSNVPCGTNCIKPNACTNVQMQGDRRTCDVQCTTSPITAPRDNDGCCPRNANANNDNDCRPTCGNGVTEPGEDCDGSDCPSSCPDNGDLCVAETTPTIRNCEVSCSLSRVAYCGQYTACGPGNGCAPNFGCGGFGVCQWRDSCQNRDDCPDVAGLTKACVSAYCVAGCVTQRDCPPHTTCTDDGINNTKYCRKSS